ncbi:MAG: energy transducer TonB [Bacteroidota bacterium]
MKSLLIDEIVFKNRNKAYGAYILRKRYNRSLYLSLIFSLIFFVVIVFVAVIYNTNADEEYYDFNNVVFEYSDLNYVPDLPPKSPENSKPPDNQIISSKTDNLNEIKLVNDSATITDTTLIKDNTTANADSLNGNSNGGNGSDTGIVFTSIQEAPIFPGGEAARIKFIQEHFNYASLGTNIKIEGVVLVTFTVEKDGSLSGIKILNSVGAACDNEVINMVKQMPKWTPGKRNGLPIPVIFKMPIRFPSTVQL